MQDDNDLIRKLQEEIEKGAIPLGEKQNPIWEWVNPLLINLVCPFCKEKGFDAIGLVYHLQNYCEIYEQTLKLQSAEEIERWAQRKLKEK